MKKLTPSLEKSRIIGKFHEALFQLFQIPTDFISPEGKNYFFGVSKQCNPLCAFIRSTPEGAAKCEACDQENLGIALDLKREHIYFCHAGLIDIIVPIFIRNAYCGSVSSGQLLHLPPDESHFNAFLKKNQYLLQYCDKSRLRKLYFGSPSLSPEQLKGLTNMLSLITGYVIDCEARLKFLGSLDENNPINRACEYIEGHFNISLSIKQIASKFNLSESHFSHLFKKETGFTVIDYINRCRISYAMEQLRNTEIPITEIAFNAGFQSLMHFDRIFQKFNRENPRNYRKKNGWYKG